MSVTASTIASLLLSGGAGAGITALITPIVQHFGHRSEARAHAADMIAEAAGNMSERQDKIIEKQDKQIQEMRESMIELIEIVDTVLTGVGFATIAVRLRKANNEAKKAIY